MKKLTARIYDSVKQLGNLTPIAFVTAFLPMLGSATLLIVALPLGGWLRANWEIGAAFYLLGIVFFCGLALLPTNVIGIVGGWAFGFPLGILLLIGGVVGAATVSFLIHRRIAGNRLPEFFDRQPKAKAIYEALIGQSGGRATLIIFLLRMSPAMPFALTNFLMAAARVPLKSYVVGTFFGMLPRSSAVVLIGAGLSELNFDDTQNFWILLTGIAATIISVVVITNISRRALERLTKQSETV